MDHGYEIRNSILNKNIYNVHYKKYKELFIQIIVN